VDYMHGVLLGVAKHMCSLWLELKSDAEWHIENKKNHN